MVVATTKNAAVVATASTSVASRNTLATTKNTSVVVKTTKNTTKNTSVVTVATKNTSPATKNTSPATKNAMVVVATTKEASRATKNTSVVVTNNATVLAVTNNASLVATNTSMEGAEETRQTCQSFQCSGERCYQDGAHANGTATCHNETHCELYRFSSTNYSAGCSSGCSAEPCSAKGSRQQQCALECCAGPLCLQLNATAYGDLPPTTTTAVLTTTATSPRPPPQNGKVCAAFSCHGDQCFKGRKTITRCILGQDFCEMKKMGLNYVSGCSKACKAAKPVCAGGMKAACYQECCPATPKGSCLKLDGKVHINSAGQVTLAPLLKVMACGVVLLLNYRVSTSLWG
nr:mucin-5AC [Taeniopygia guttata]